MYQSVIILAFAAIFNLLNRSILAWMSEMEVMMRRGLEASLARMEKMLSDNQDTVVAIQEVITRVEEMSSGNRHTSNSYNNSTNNEGERRWWRRKEEREKLDKPAHLTIRVLWVLVSDCETSAVTL